MAKVYHRTVQPNQPISDWLRQLWLRKETLYFFVWRDLKVQYQSPFLGVLWSVLQPLIYFGIILSVMKMSGRSGSIDEMPFQVYLISGLAIWNFVTTTITSAVGGLQSNASIITKASFPRFYLILSPFIRGSIDLLVVLLIVIGIAYYNDLSLGLTTLYLLPFSILLLISSTIGFASIATSLVAHNRHIKHIIPILLYAGLFLLPVFYSASESELIITINSFNPISGSMSLLRGCFSNNSLAAESVAIWSLLSFVWLFFGILSFKKTEKTLADKL